MLTRREAETLIEDCGPEVSALRALAEHWDMAGHWNEHADADTLASALYELIEEHTDADHVRSYGPSPDDATDLTAPEHACANEPAHCDGRPTFCRVCGEPIG